MATTNAPKPGRALAVLVLAIVVMYALMFVKGDTKPRLGLDLKGGTSVTLTARNTNGGSVTKDAMSQAVDIIRQRVNSRGVSEAEVTTQGDRNIIVAVPGKGQREVVKLVAQTAQLNFRPVLSVTGGAPVAQPTPTPTKSPKPTKSPTKKPTKKSTNKTSASPSPTSTSNNRPLTSALRAAPTTSPSPSPSASSSAPAPSASPSPQPSPPGVGGVTPALQKRFAQLDCTIAKNRAGTGGGDDPKQPIVACNRDGQEKYLLDKAVVLGTAIDGASAQLPQQGIGDWEVILDFDGKGTKEFGAATQAAVNKTAPQNQIAIVLDGLVVSAPQINEPIPGGNAQITGNFSQQEASDLANVLKYGALPLAFDQSEVTSISPTLGSDQLDAGLLAGALGLLLVIVYSLLYYRGLGIVVIASLGVAALVTYGAVVLLGSYLDFALTLAGVAGLIVAIGITADSFVVYFERLRDEVREGRTLRVAVETGWVRARRTILVADSVSFLAAVVLYVLSIGGVRGFAFTLGLTTLIDVAVVFLFTKPIVTMLARTRFFGGGHRLSGLDPKRLGARLRQPASAVRRRPAVGAKEA